MAMAQKVHMPAKKPAMVPHCISVFTAQPSGQVAVGSERNMPRLTAISKEKIKVKPKILPLLPPFLICSSVKPLSFIQAFPKRPGEYQMPPTANAETPATKTASQLIEPTSIIIDFGVYDISNLFPNFYQLNTNCTRSEEHTSELQSQSNLVC